ncbi:MAG TPA: DinB family protein [Pyrinomonadaceae bacterium]|nr:DinB family protein [Pyrinomonadaceae bacterium]
MKNEIARLDATHQKLLDLIQPIDDERFRQRPAPDQWSIAEIVHHLCMVEQRVLEELERSLERPAVHVGLLQRLIPVRLLVGRRVVRVKAPKTVEPLDAPSKEEVIANYEQVRRTLKEFSATHGRQRLQQIGIKHPFLGQFDGVGAISFVGHHETRHIKQIKETIKKIGA